MTRWLTLVPSVTALRARHRSQAKYAGRAVTLEECRDDASGPQLSAMAFLVSQRQRIGKEAMS